MQKAKKTFTNTDACCNNIANRYKKRKIHTEINSEYCRKLFEGRETTMKIVFWSNYPKSDVTSNMTAVCVMFSLLFPSKVMMMTNHCNHGNLGRTLLGRYYDEVLREESGYLSGTGLHPTIKRIEDAPSCFNIPRSAECLSEDGLYYFAQGKLFNNEIYELRVMEELNRFMEYLNESEDYIFIDVKSQDSISTVSLLEEADVVVVNLKQDEKLMKDFFRKYGAITGKAFFFISEYKHRNGYTKNKFVNEFSIHPNRVAVIPYNPEFVPLVDDGRITEYVMRNHDCKKNTKEYYYIWHLKKAARLLKKILDHQPHLAMATEKQYA